MFQHILVPIDGSELSERAASTSLQFASLDADAHLGHVPRRTREGCWRVLVPKGVMSRSKLPMLVLH